VGTALEYRAYIVGNDGHFLRFSSMTCSQDDDAIVWAKQLTDGVAVELWTGKRFVARFENNSGSER
jgi:hypothetical protein